ncbi:membrane protease YdiL (CAAX protease family) [Hamadaea flava]|uniref:CPBP family intramembrane glutamic endopeptidase n=1 Tax=Hamadaea flava TaxID=1742688 RepID=A0ABV8LNC8_9ACTN|nr:type II CAAX endopeptidase family protein [Hamadaea flava]MCP2322957.1 membrane protease YdiL (CAAX protease family) [Hamadaea flava]
MKIVFLLVAFVGAGLLGAVQPATGLPTEILQLTQFGPALGVAVALIFWPTRVKALLAGAFSGRGGTRTGLALAATAVVVVTGAAAVYGLIGGDAGPTMPQHSLLVIAVAQFVGACGEEIGWRCFLQPAVRTRWGVLASSTAVGLIWGLWHPVFAEGWAYATAFVVATVSMSIVLGVALDGVRAHRLWLAGTFHTLVNLAMLLFMDEESGAVVPMALLAATCAVAAVGWLASRATNMPRVESQAG